MSNTMRASAAQIPPKVTMLQRSFSMHGVLLIVLTNCEQTSCSPECRQFLTL
jgi:hypothetical protein